MNANRIQELAEQAGLLGPSSRVGNAHEATKKFAELIIAECAKLCEPAAQIEQKRPQNCGSGFCSCIECVMEPVLINGLTESETSASMSVMGLSKPSQPEQKTDWEGIAADQALTIALMNSEQEPVAWMTQARNFIHPSECTKSEAKMWGWLPVYTSPAREWVGLTDDERAECWSSSAKQSAINIEAKLKEKNT